MDDTPLDFMRYLSERLGTGEAETDALLGRWLREYQPISERRPEPRGAMPLAKTTGKSEESLKATA